MSFVTITYKMVNESDPTILGWDDDGESFVVRNTEQFVSDIIPRYFKHSNMASFTRQLNFYSFHKVKSERAARHELEFGWLYFKHALFIRGNNELLDKIQRKTYVSENDKDDVACLKRHLEKLQDRVEALTETVSSIKYSIDFLLLDRVERSEIDNLNSELYMCKKRKHD